MVSAPNMSGWYTLDSPRLSSPDERGESAWGVNHATDDLFDCEDLTFFGFDTRPRQIPLQDRYRVRADWIQITYL